MRNATFTYTQSKNWPKALKAFIGGATLHPNPLVLFWFNDEPPSLTHQQGVEKNSI
jgi:hypothetical protein